MGQGACRQEAEGAQLWSCGPLLPRRTPVCHRVGTASQVPKPERKARAAEILRDVKPGREDLYLPVNAQARILDVIPDSATPMQSAAKVEMRPLPTSGM